MFKKNVTPKEQLLKVYPNPASVNDLLYLKELPEGNYTLRLVSMLGVETASVCVNVSGKNGAVSWQLPAGLQAGNYTIVAMQHVKSTVRTARLVLLDRR